MTGKIESMAKGTEKLSERIHTIEFDSQNLFKSYDRLAHYPNNIQGWDVIFKGKTLDLGITCVEWEPEAKCLNEITRNIYRPGDSDFTEDSSKKI